jgi:hypothetical protein
MAASGISIIAGVDMAREIGFVHGELVAVECALQMHRSGGTAKAAEMAAKAGVDDGFWETILRAAQGGRHR